MVGQVLGIARPDGERVWIEVDVRPVQRRVSTAKLIVSSFRDITAAQGGRGPHACAVGDRRVVERRDLPPVGLDGIIESWNAGAEALYGFSAARGARRATTRSIVPEDHLLEAEQILLAAANGTSIDNLLTVRRRKDGTPSTSSSPPRRCSTPPAPSSACREVAGDVTELIATRDALAQSEERFRSLVQRSADVAFVLDADGVITYASPAVERFGYRPDDARRASRAATSSTPTTSRATATPCSRPSRAPAPRPSSGGSGRPTARTAGCEEVLTDMHDEPAVGGLGRQHPRHHRPAAGRGGARRGRGAVPAGLRAIGVRARGRSTSSRPSRR